MYDEIISEIKSNLGTNRDLNRKYLSGEMEKYADHPYGKEILRELSRMMWDCLSDSEKEEFIEISNAENPIMDILEEIRPDIESGMYRNALNKLDEFMESFYPMFEDDKVSEYHYFTNILEEIIFREYIGAKKEIRYIPQNQPLLDLYYIYGFLLLEDQQYDKSELYLKKAIHINPVSSRIILELTEIYKMHTYTLNKYFMFVSDALKYAYLPQDIARCYRGMGYYYVEENQTDIALALLTYSMEYELSPMAYSEISYIKAKNGDLDLSLEESIEIIKSKNIQLGPNPFILKTLNNLAEEYLEKKIYNPAIYYYEILYNLTDDEETAEKLKNLASKINY